MRTAVIFASLTLLAAGAAAARTPQQCTSQWDELRRGGRTGVLDYAAFMRNCLANTAPTVLPSVDRPDAAPPDATARCRDGTYTAARVRLDACLHHGGVEALLR